ncbi:MAG TPA: MFS transporter [Candidatus Dormibacteraeota bacterium]|jgi:DHA1 family tetracycline resistance protein-like MFS transporter|nr:MFS transporter [Candidatus Dormibacteraeota bacterium]
MYRRTLWTLYAVNFLNAIGGWFFLPLLPIFLGRRGGSSALVGAVVAAGLLSNAAIRYPAGWAADRFGTRPVMLTAMAGTATLFLAYLLPLPAPAFIVVRFIQGGAQGAYWPAANGLLAQITPAQERGRVFGFMQSTNLAGMLIGPGIGGFIALFNLGIVFAVAAAMSTAAMAALVTLQNVRVEPSPEAPVRALHIARRLLPLILLGAGTSYMIGTFDTIWPLYLTYRGANTFAVGLSFMTFALPAMLLSSPAGMLGDRFGPRRFIVVALLFTAFFAGLYPFVASVPWLIGLGLVEGAFTISGAPSLMAEVSRSSEHGHQARTQGVFQTVQTLVQILGALGGGALYTLSPTAAFLAIAAVCLLAASTALIPRVTRTTPATEVL